MSSRRQKHRVGNDVSSEEHPIGENSFARPNVQSRPASRRNDLRQELIARRAAHQAELERLDEELLAIKDLRKKQIQNIENLTQQLDTLDERVASGSSAQNYFDKFEWSNRLREQMRRVFGIEDFRLAQEGVCNANMDGRDIICIMPTGGGKSLTYQLPATLTPGCTLVISPLVSLMRDQIFHLQEHNIEGLMFTASMSNAEKNEAYGRLNATATGKGPAQKEVKLCYVTPERIGKSQKFVSVISKVAAAKKLVRIVIDEAHCVSTQGHDYRPDYKRLSGLRKLFPHVPILALSATCPPDVLHDLITILGLPPPTDGRVAAPYGTVKFTSPLYRKNLHYKVLSKPSGAAQVVKDMVKYILEYHPDETGIVYCLSRADSEKTATQLRTESDGRIKTGVYHAEINDKKKEELHESWRSGQVKVMCATIAFGLGIDKQDVRFVLHHSVSKSVETFYQESGRAGRDGNDADCILYYRLQDALRLSGTVQDPDCERKVHGMIKFCLDFKECRKLVFANYFSSCDWAEDDTRCGHCDNCTRDPTSVIDSDVTLDAKHVLATARALCSRKIKVTAAQLAQAARGSGPHGKLLQPTPGDRVKLSPPDTEALIAHMLLEGFLGKSYVAGEWRVQVYVQPGPFSRRLDEGQRLVIQLLLQERAPRNRHINEGGRKRKARGRPGQGSSTARVSEEDDADFTDNNSGEDREYLVEQEKALGPSAKRRRSDHGSSWVPVPLDDAGWNTDIESDSDPESDDAEWKGNLRGAPTITHRTVRRSPRKAPPPSALGIDALRDNEIIDISSE